MTSTSFNEFRKMFYKIPKDRLDYVHFIPLRTGTKVPIGNWKGKVHLSYYDIKSVMGYGGNIAVAAIPKGLMFLDIDRKRFPVGIPNSLLQQIPNTFTVLTRSGGLHFYFLNDGNWDNQKFFLGGIEIGELRTNWQYVVSAGSWVEPEMYKIINEVPIVHFEGEITDYFRKGNVKDLSPNRPPPTEGKIGKPISEELKRKIELSKGEIDTKSNRRLQILEKLKRR